MQNMYPLANPEQTNLHAVFPLDEVLPTGWMIVLRKNLLQEDSKKKFQYPLREGFHMSYFPMFLENCTCVENTFKSAATTTAVRFF